jgi:hypothetical protein
VGATAHYRGGHGDYLHIIEVVGVIWGRRIT